MGNNRIGMKLYRISQSVNNGWDTYDSAVVAAESEQDARLIHPGGNRDWDGRDWGFNYINGDRANDGAFSTWAKIDDIKVEYIGEAAEGIGGVICASFNAG